MKTKNKNLVYFVLIFALILAFCGALLLSVFVGERVAFADEEVTDTYLCTLSQIFSFQSSYYNQQSITHGSLSSQVSSYDTFPSSVSFTDSLGDLNNRYSEFHFRSSSSTNDIFCVHCSNNAANIHPLSSDTQILITFMISSNDPTAKFSFSFGYNSDPLSLPKYSLPDDGKFFCLIFPRDGTLSTNSLNLYGFKSLSESGNPTFTVSRVNYFANFIDNFNYPLTLTNDNVKSVFTSLFPLPFYNYGTYQFRVNLDAQTAYMSGFSDGFENGFDRGYKDGVNSVLSSIGSSVSSDISSFPSGTQTYFTRADGAYWHQTAYISDKGYIDYFPNFSFGQLKTLGMASTFWGAYGISTYTADTVPPSWTANSFNLISDRAYFTSFYTAFDDSNQTIQFFFSIEGKNLTPIRDIIPLQIILYSDHLALNIQWQEIGIVDDLMQVYTFTFLPNKLQSYEFTFYTTSENALSLYNAGYQYAISTVNDTSASWFAGYNAGVSSAQNTTFDSLMSAVIDVPIRTIGGLLDFNFLGINLLQFIYSLLTLGIIIAIIRLCLGKS